MLVNSGFDFLTVGGRIQIARGAFEFPLRDQAAVRGGELEGGPLPAGRHGGVLVD